MPCQLARSRGSALCASIGRFARKGARVVSLETYLRVVRPGPGLYVNVREARVEGPDLSSDILERACGALRHRHGCAAVVVRGDRPTLFVASSQPIPEIELNQPQWTLKVTDAGGDTRSLSLHDAQGASVLIPRLVEACASRHLGSSTAAMDSRQSKAMGTNPNLSHAIAAFRAYRRSTPCPAS